MAENKFQAFLQESRKPWWSDNLCDFVDHAVDDRELPDAESWEELKTYLVEKWNAPDKVLSAAQYVWKLYDAEDLGKTD